MSLEKRQSLDLLKYMFRSFLSPNELCKHTVDCVALAEIGRRLCAMLLLFMAQHSWWSGPWFHIVMQSGEVSQYGGGKSFQVPEPDGGAAKSCCLWTETWRHRQDLNPWDSVCKLHCTTQEIWVLLSSIKSLLIKEGCFGSKCPSYYKIIWYFVIL